ncbi:glycosyltransferase [Aeromonas caviae]|uniref:glycosyltransferase n=1 Tax=Aeromonas caviae TaxID=648 RepID=UPI002B48BD14|nr:glycosyltransferase [Aeromonas caviae]
MKFSVLMSLYIKEQSNYLYESLESLYNQTKPADEIVIVYDGPVGDELTGVISYWMEKLPIKVVRLTENVGLGKALNFGLYHCSHEYIARMDTDDICVPKRFEYQLSAFNEDPELILVGGNIIEFEGSIDQLLSARVVPESNQSITRFIKKRNPFNHMTVMFKKKEIILAGGYMDHHFMEDYNLWLRCVSLKYKVKNINNVLVYARAGQSMISRRSGVKYIKSEYDLMNIKVSLGIDNKVNAFFCFLLRSSTRVLPTPILAKMYRKILRSN